MRKRLLTYSQYNILSCTWGLPQTLLGSILASLLLLAGYEPMQNLYGWVFLIGKPSVSWGFSLGPYAFITTPSDYLLDHEFGHSIQNCYLGPFSIVFVLIPSIIRFWYRNFKHYLLKVPYSSMPSYDSIWFEGNATYLGRVYRGVAKR